MKIFWPFLRALCAHFAQAGSCAAPSIKILDPKSLGPRPLCATIYLCLLSTLTLKSLFYGLLGRPLLAFSWMNICNLYVEFSLVFLCDHGQSFCGSTCTACSKSGPLWSHTSVSASLNSEFFSPFQLWLQASYLVSSGFLHLGPRRMGFLKHCAW